MKKKSSAVWHFFDRVEENKRCVAVVCKLCDNEYKYFGNTTNLRVHLTKKHPYQWEMKNSTPWGDEKSTDESNVHLLDEDDTDSTITSPRNKNSGKDKNVRYSLSIKQPNNASKMPKIEIQRIDILNESREQSDDEDTSQLVQQLHEEWLDEEQCRPMKKQKTKYRRIKREVVSPAPVSNHIYVPDHDIQQKREFLQIQAQETDEMTSFGKYIGNKLRKVKSAQTRSNLQQIITTVMWQAEFGVYDDPNAVKLFLMSSIRENFPEQTVQQDTGNSSVQETIVVTGNVMDQ